MTRDEITAMARNCGWAKVGREMEYPVLTARLERFAALVSAVEREACAKVCDGIRYNGYCPPEDGAAPDYYNSAAAECAATIRARGE